MIITFLILSIIVLGLILDRRYSGEPVKDDPVPVRLPYSPFPEPSRPSYSYIHIRQYGEWYNLRFRHIKKYKRNAIRKK